MTTISRGPYTLSQDDLNSGIFLRNLTSAEEMAFFLELRGSVLDALPNRAPEAELAYSEAHALVPNNIQHFGWLALCVGREEMEARGACLSLPIPITRTATRYRCRTRNFHPIALPLR